MARKKKQVFSTMFRATPKQTENGTYRIQVSVGQNPETGKSIMKSFTADTPMGAVKKAEDYLSGKQQKEENMTVGEAVEKYIEIKEHVLSPTTIDSYRRKRKNNLQSVVDIPLKKLTNQQMQIAVNLDSARLSPKTVRVAYGLFSAAIKMFSPEINLKVTLPAKQNKIKEFPDVQDIIKAIQGTEIELPCMLALWLSLRMSEVRGIRYKDIYGNVLTVRETVVTVAGEHVQKNQTKTFKSTRQLQLPEYLLSLIESNKPEDSKPDDFIVKMTGQAIYKRFVKILEKNHLPHITFHDLRHLNASVMLMLGVPDKYAMERGGWSSNYTLQNVYQHTFSQKRKEIDNQIDDYFNKLI